MAVLQQVQTPVPAVGATPGGRVPAVTIGVVLLVATVALPFARTPLPAVVPFLPAFGTAAIIGDLLTAALLFQRYRADGSGYAFRLAVTYLFSGLIVAPHLATFPGVFSTTGLLGAGPTTATWFWVAWHAGFACALLLSAALPTRRPVARRSDSARTIALAAVAVSAGITALSLFLLRAQSWLPPIIVANDYRSLARSLGLPMLVVALAAIAAVGRRARRGTALDRWLLVATVATLADISLTLLAGSRYTAGWYISRLNSLVAGSVVLFAMLAEVPRHYRTLVQAERQRAAELQELAEARALYEATAEHLADGLAVMDRDDRVIYWNRRLEHLYGLPREAVLGRPLAAVQQPIYARTTDAEATKRHAEQAMATALAGTPSSFQYRLDGESPRDLDVRVFPIGEREGSLGHGRLVRDVTKEREVERLKDELVSVVSHELRTPLASLVGFSELLLTRELTEGQRRQYTQTMLQEGQRLTALINDFLDLQRIESGRQELVPLPVDLPPIVERVLHVLGPHEASPVVADLPPGLPLILADADRLQQVLTNLLVNARKYSPAGGAVQLSAHPKDGVVEVAVRDQGLGIPAEALPRLFQQFYRVDNSDRRTIKGTGLGLAICRRIIEAHGGHIWAESAGLGRGATFRFTLPIVRAGTPVGDVLIVEDDPGFAHLLEAALTAQGYSSVHVAGAEAAIAQLSAAPVRALVLDLLLPGRSGEALLRQVRAQCNDLPVVVVTMRDLDQQILQVLAELGVLETMRKGPGVAVHVAATIEQVLDRVPAGAGTSPEGPRDADRADR